jgi:type II secretory ATPase GspE/PulE/Tfp pilus assembly ATPase PilB-like protein
MEKGMRTLYQDGMLKVALGITTVEEVERVTHFQSHNGAIAT